MFIQYLTWSLLWIYCRRLEIFGAKLSSKPCPSLSLASSLRKRSSGKSARASSSNNDVFEDSCLLSTVDSPARNGKQVESWVEECVHEVCSISSSFLVHGLMFSTFSFSTSAIPNKKQRLCQFLLPSWIFHWFRSFCDQIVRNIQEAPFLQYVFDNKGRLGRTNRQKVSQDLFENADYWPGLQLSLSEASPDGIILVQKLDPASPVNSPWVDASSSTDDKGAPPLCPFQAEGETCVWGVLVQAKGVNRHACYLLKTTRLCSSFGICATRYSLTKAKCFGPSQIEQLENAWLL